MRNLFLALICLVLLTGAACRAEEPRPKDLEVPAGDVALYARRAGSPHADAVLIAINGGPGQSSHGMVSLEQLAGDDLAVVTYDQRGTGRSSAPVESVASYALRKYVEDLEAVRAAVDAEQVHLLGQSWGGLVALRYATLYPERVGSIVLVGSAPPTWQALTEARSSLDERVEALQWTGVIPPVLPASGAELLVAVLPAYFADPRFDPPGEIGPEALAAHYSDAVYRLTMQGLSDYDLTADLGRLDHEVLVLMGEDDPFGLAAAEAIQDALTGTDAELVALEACGHFWQECPAPFFARLRAFWGLPEAGAR
jgi:pimeloyl-ACP methyl ester carboxylesterase